MPTYNAPDYLLWIRKENWTLTEAALLLHELDPSIYRNIVKPYQKEVPPKFTAIKDSYMLLRSVPWRRRYPGCHSFSEGLNPVVIWLEAISKELPQPIELAQLFEVRYPRQIQYHSAQQQADQLHYLTDLMDEEEIATAVTTDTLSSPDPKPLSTRERNNLLTALGLLVNLYFKRKETAPIYYRGGKLNASQVSQFLLKEAEAYGLETAGLKSLDRKITEALALIGEKK